MPRFAASHLVLFCLPMSHKKDARIKQVKGNTHMIGQFSSKCTQDGLLEILSETPNENINVKKSLEVKYHQCNKLTFSMNSYRC